VESRFTLCIDVRTTLSEPAFESRYPNLLSGIIREVKSPRRLSLSDALYARVVLIPEMVAIKYTIFPGGAIASGLNTLAALILVPSRLVLPAFWLLVTLGVLYVVLPQRARGWMKIALVQGWKKMAKHRQ
jgi:hypothetical protein